MSRSSIEINTEVGFDPPDRLRAALEAVIDAYNEQLSESTDDEVAGFAATALQIGDLRGGMGTGTVQGWRDGCWGFYPDGKGGASCGWMQSGDTSCVGYKI